MDEPATCGQGLAEHATVPARIAGLLTALAENLEAHLPTIDVGSAGGTTERDAYASLIAGFREVADRLASVSGEMAGYRDLPMAPHHEAAFHDPRLAGAFARYVTLEGELAELLNESHARDRRMLKSMSGERQD